MTAAFNRNLLVRINRELGGDFDLDAVRAPRGLERGGVARRDAPRQPDAEQHVRIGAASLELTFDAGETIWTESSYKYRPDGVAQMLQRAGFRLMMQWTDEAGGFALTLVEAN